MVRPRTKAVPSTTQAHTKPQTRASRIALKEKTNTTLSPRYADDGDTERLVKDARPKRGPSSKRSPSSNTDFYMTGAIGYQQVRETAPDVVVARKVSKRSRGPATSIMTSTRDATQQHETVRGLGKKGYRSAIETSTPKTTRHGVQQISEDKVGDSQANSAHVPEPVGRDDSLLHLTDSGIDQTSITDSPSPPPPSRAQSVKRGRVGRGSLAQPGSASRTTETPAIDSSVLLRNFKRRPRQPSMLAMVHQHQQIMSAQASQSHLDLSQAVRSSDDDDEDHDITFDIEAGLESDGDLGDFEPEAEGTPLLHAKSTLHEISGSTSTNQDRPGKDPRKRISSEMASASNTPETVGTKRRKSLPRKPYDSTWGDRSNVEVSRSPASSPPPFRPSDDALDSEVLILRSSPITSLPAIAPGFESGDSRKLLTSGDVDKQNIIAIPSSGLERNALRNSALFGRKGEEPIPRKDPFTVPELSSPLTEYSEEDLLADPSSQASQLSPPQVKKRVPAAKPVRTSKLQSLLPKRRIRAVHSRKKSDFDVESSSLSDREDLSAVSSERDPDDETWHEARKIPPSRSFVKGDARARTRKDKPGRLAGTSRAGRASALASHSKAGRTYGRSAADEAQRNEVDESDGEGEAEESVVPDDGVASVEAARSKELEDAKKKFAEIDEWDGLEFENFDSEDHRSSSQGWR